MTNEFGAPLDSNGYAPSILTGDDASCYVCYYPVTARHEVFFGNKRELSKRYGLWLPLCAPHGDMCGHHAEQHNDADKRANMQSWAQRVAMETYGWSIEDFTRIFGKNYLED